MFFDGKTTMSYPCNANRDFLTTSMVFRLITFRVTAFLASFALTTTAMRGGQKANVFAFCGKLPCFQYVAGFPGEASADLLKVKRKNFPLRPEPSFNTARISRLFLNLLMFGSMCRRTYKASLSRPFLRLCRRTRLPPVLRMRFKKPCTRRRLRFFGL